jgi:hypothetical protein
MLRKQLEIPPAAKALVRDMQAFLNHQVASPAGHGKAKVKSLAELVTIAERLGLLA